MKETDGRDEAAATQTDANDGDVGDLETAGETTAAEMIGGAPDTRPVGVDTLADIKISGEHE
ncbi:MAG: hypothetical protein QOG00_2457 [Pyrinomonadaceae bacterium]|nr:hypothetical protein [Pyrinomonadaceae bacterium]